VRGRRMEAPARDAGADGLRAGVQRLDARRRRLRHGALAPFRARLQAPLLRGRTRPGARRRLMGRILLALAAFLFSTSAAALDRTHAAWDAGLKKPGSDVQNGNASRVDYAGFARDRAQLKAVLDDYQKVTRAEFD